MPLSRTEVYDRIHNASLSVRDAEAAAIMKITSMMKRERAQWNSTAVDKRLETTLRLNHRLWTLFQVSLHDEQNPMPLPTKKRLLRLGEYVERATVELLAFPSAEKLDILIQINQDVAAGLMGSAP